MAHKSIGEINLFAARISERSNSLVCHDANDFSPLRLRRAQPNQNPFADSRLIREGLRSKELIDDYKATSLRVVYFGKSSPSKQWSMECLEISRK
jgi:hypothetical protein